MEPKGNGSNNYDVKQDVPRFPFRGPQFAARIVAWVIAIAIIIGVPYGAYRAGKYLYNKGQSDIKTEFVKQMASSQYGEVDEFGFSHVSGGQVMITYNFKPFAEKPVKK